MKGFVLFLCTSICVTNATLKYVQVLFRHGDRTPVHVYPRDPHQANAWPEGLGQLTQIGKQQGYELGMFLRERYVTPGTLLNPHTDLDEFNALSSYSDRSIMTAQTMLAAMFPPVTGHFFHPQLRWDPIPIHTTVEGNDYLLKVKCPTYDKKKEELAKSDKAKEIVHRYQHLIDLIGIHSGYEPTFENLFEMVDPIYVEYQHNMTFPPWLVTNGTFREFVHLKDLKAQLKFHTKDMAILKGGALWGKLLSNMDDVKANKIQRKADFFAGHDTTINAVMSSLGIFNDIHMNYAVALLFELYKDTKGDYSLKIFFRNDTKHNPYPLTIPGCTESCPLSKLHDLTDDVIPDDPEVACKGDKPEKAHVPCSGKTTTFQALPAVLLMVWNVALTVLWHRKI